MEAGIPLTQLNEVSVGDNLRLTLKAPVVIMGDSPDEFLIDGDLVCEGEVFGGMNTQMSPPYVPITTPPWDDQYRFPNIQLVDLNGTLSFSLQDDGGEENPVTGATASHIIVERIV